MTKFNNQEVIEGQLFHHGDDGTFEELLPCPFCESTDLNIDNTHTPYYWVTCQECGVATDSENPDPRAGGNIVTLPLDEQNAIHKASIVRAIEKWNTRGIEQQGYDSLKAENERLKSLLQKIADYIPIPSSGGALGPHYINEIKKALSGTTSLTGLQWTKEKPSKPGYYWYRDGQESYVIELTASSAGVQVWHCANECSYSLNEYRGEWAGPIAQPIALSEPNAQQGAEEQENG